MKGRPISQAEFDRFLKAIPAVVSDQADAWCFFARGLWYQGLRVNEALHLSWDREDWHRGDLGQERPVIWIRGHLEKGKKDRVNPMTPEFAELLAQVPEHERTGPVFILPEVDRTKPKWQRAWVSGVGMPIGRAAGVLMSKEPQTGKDKFASFHDLRRSCALCWAAHLMPHELMKFMRHSSMQVTVDYCVGQRAMQTAQ